MTKKTELEEALSGIDESKRRTLIRIGLGVTFVTPIVASFSMEGLTISKVQAAAQDGWDWLNHPIRKRIKTKITTTTSISCRLLVWGRPCG